MDILFGDHANGRSDLRGEGSSKRSRHEDVLFDRAHFEMKIEQERLPGAKLDASVE